MIVRTTNGHGSGFAIGDGNYILTNAHVVGKANKVRVIHKDLDNVIGEVISINKYRDVALIRISKNYLKPLYLNLSLPRQLDKVFAVGAPLDEELSGTITSGIISAIREYDKLNWIQSDVAINPGNSGGPLLDSNGFVIGISTAGIMQSGSQVGLNLMVPIGEAIKVLNINIIK